MPFGLLIDPSYTPPRRWSPQRMPSRRSAGWIFKVRPCSHLEWQRSCRNRRPLAVPPKACRCANGSGSRSGSHSPVPRYYWADIALLEGMSERTLRYHLARWKAELERETQPTSELLRACEERAEHYMIAFAPRSVAHPDRARGGRRSGRAARRSQAARGTGDS